MASSRNRLHRAFGLDAEHHGSHNPVSTDAEGELQVVNLGLSRTGTTSMHIALEMLGFGPGHQGVDLYRHPDQNRAFASLIHDLNAGTAGPSKVVSRRLRAILKGYRCANDGPINHLVGECLAAYPQAKYILCLRDGGQQAWWKSFDAAVGLHFRRDWSRMVFRTLIWPVSFIRHQDDFTQEYKIKIEADLGVPIGPETYARHNERVKNLIPAEQLLIFQVNQGWEPLCRFLNVDVPDQPFPTGNEVESMKKIYFGMQAFGAFVWCLYLAGLLGAIGLVRFFSH